MSPRLPRRHVLATAAAALASPALAAPAVHAADRPVTVGVLTDETGVLSSISGLGSVLAARMAIEDFGGTVLSRPVRLLNADHQNKPDIGVAIARKWFDTEGVSMITDLANSAVALAVQNLAHARGQVTLSSTGGTIELMGKQCSPTGATWANYTYSASVGLVRYFMDQLHKKTWFLMSADYAFGHSMLDQAAKAIAAHGGKVLGTIYHPLGTSDYSSYLLTAQASGAEVLMLGNAGTDLVNAIKQAHQMHLPQMIAASVVTIIDVHAIGLADAGGMTFLTSFYWDRDDRTRAFAKRFMAKHGAPPTMFQAGTYSTTLTYLKAMKAAGSAEGIKVMEAMRAMPIEDVFSRHGRLRIDGRLVHDMLVARAKQPGKGVGAWDLFDVVTVLPGDAVFRPLSESDCPLVHS